MIHINPRAEHRVETPALLCCIIYQKCAKSPSFLACALTTFVDALKFHFVSQRFLASVGSICEFPVNGSDDLEVGVNDARGTEVVAEEFENLRAMAAA